MLRDIKIGIIGTGNIGEALIKGLIESKSSNPGNIICYDPRRERLQSLKREYGLTTAKNNTDLVEKAEIIIYAVKPQIISKVLKETTPKLSMDKLIISVAAGVPLTAIESCLKKNLRLIRVMPNVGVAIREGATGIAAGKHALKKDLKLAKAIFDSVGKSVFIEENVLMDAVTGLSGSGPAFIFMIIDALADAGVKMGLSRDDSLFLTTQTVLGSAKLLMETKEHPGRLKDKVTSPGGTTIAGIHTLEEGGMRATLINAVEAATIRSRELGEIMIKNFEENNGL